MPTQRYSVNQYDVQTLLTWIKADQIAIPDIQRPFVWDAAKVRDFIDSLYQGYPVGYLIAWQNPNVRLKDGSQSSGKRILIDGQQRLTAMQTALFGNHVISKVYKRVRISIAFHPGNERFEVTNPAIRGDRGWIPDIAAVFAPDVKILGVLDAYCQANPDIDKDEIYARLEHLRGILYNTLGLIDLSQDLDVETVAEVFRRINSQGVPLNEADFAMSKMAASEQFDGHHLRKGIDYFCHLAVAPQDYEDLTNDDEFAATDYFRAMRWLKDEKDNIYDPTYTDMLRVAFTSEFKRGRLAELVALLTGRNFETRTYEEEIAEDTFRRLKDGTLDFMNETNFTRFVTILKSAGFRYSSLIRSQNTVNFAYILFLTLRALKTPSAEIETLVRRWFVMSVLTGRYTSNPETAFSVDIRNVDQQGAHSYLDTIERAGLSDAFWNVGLPQQMDTSVASSPYFNVFLASQVAGDDKGFLSKHITVPNLLEGQWHIHHVFPKNYLVKVKGLKSNQYNQIGNYVVMQPEINIAIGDNPPATYFSELWEQCNGGKLRYGAIKDAGELRDNLASHCIPEGVEAMDYDEFLRRRRVLMAAKIRDFYWKL